MTRPLHNIHNHMPRGRPLHLGTRGIAEHQPLQRDDAQRGDECQDKALYIVLISRQLGERGGGRNKSHKPCHTINVCAQNHNHTTIPKTMFWNIEHPQP
jgi:hypothetical protein